ncbi:nicotianamine synthase [Paenibacillus glycanilyticus]|uniref:nicotianamine synthase family protein n=1 Tax=Paenibacillus glycanilyticus TaxID=126569 RepID=UPI00203C849C|nr:nicotianamine synthase family protein [Paenibacillus glycanilyticus]MCM3626656.1 nicotianamine synthase [Paenibacillus glycanilyticus]
MEVYSTGSAIHTGSLPRIQVVNDFIAFIREANELLQKEIDLSPANQLVMGVISRLSQQLRSSYLPEEVQAVLSNEYIQTNQRQLQDKLSEAEFLTELSDSRQACDFHGTVMDIAKRLPNWPIYIALVGQELSTLRRLTEQGSHEPIVFVGSGPMPLSPIILHLLGDVEVVCVEMNPAAYEASRALLEHMNVGTKVTVVLDNGSSFDYGSYNRIFVASLVRNKRAVLERISRTSANPLVAVRTAEGMKQIMYEAIDEPELINQGWRILGRTIPDEKLVINSTLFLERLTDLDAKSTKNARYTYLHSEC